MIDNYSVDSLNGTMDVMEAPVYRGSIDEMQQALRVTQGLWSYVTPFIIFPGVVGNLVCIATLQTKGFSGSSTAFLLTMLSLVDTACLLLGALQVWLYYLLNFDLRTLSDPVCRLHTFLTYFCVHLSAWTLVLLTLERLVIVLCPMQATKLCSRTRLIIGWVVIFLILFTINGYVYLGHMGLESDFETIGNQTYDTGSCRFHQDLGHVYRVWGEMFISCLLPSIAILSGNIVLMFKLTRLKRPGGGRGIRTTADSSRGSTRRRNNRRSSSTITMMLVVVCIVFLLTTLPINVFLVLDMDSGNQDVQTTSRIVDFTSMARTVLIETFLRLLYYINNAANFVLYFISGPLFRKAAMELICRKKPNSHMGHHGHHATRHSTQL